MSKWLRIGPKPRHLGVSITGRKVLLVAALFVLALGVVLPVIHVAKAVVTTQTHAGSSTASGTERKVFFTTNGVSYKWWIFYSSGASIVYQSSSNGMVWSAPSVLTSSGAAGNGGAFSAYQVAGTNFLYYVVAPSSGSANVFYGELNLDPVAGLSVVAAGQFAASTAATAAAGTSIAVDGNGYTWIAVLTGGNTVEVWACKATFTATGCPSSWVAQGPVAGSSAFGVNAATTPVVLAMNSGGTYYVALAYVNPHDVNLYGQFSFYYLTSSGTGYVAWSTPVTSSNKLWQSEFWSAVSAGTTIYIAGELGGFLGSMSYTLGAAAVTSESPFIYAAGTYVPTISETGTGTPPTLVVSYPAGANVVFYYSNDGGVTWKAGANDVPARYIAYNTECNPTSVSATVGDNASGLGSMGFLWTNCGGATRFATLNLNGVPVTVTTTLTQYVFHLAGAKETGKVSASNYFTVSYWACSPSCGSPSAASVEYTTDSASLVIHNVKSQTLVTISSMTSGSGANEEWCLSMSGNSCNQTQFGASDGVTTTWEYYDLLAEPTLYSVVGGGAPSAPTITYDSAPGASSSTPSPSLISVPLSVASSTYWMLRNSTNSATASVAGQPQEQWAAGGTNDPTSWQITATPFPGTTTAGTTNTVMKDTSASWGNNYWKNAFLVYTSGPAIGEYQLITSNTANTVTTGTFSPAPSGSGDSFILLQVEPNIVYYHQYQNTFTLNTAGLVTAFDTSASFVLQGTLYGTFQNLPTSFKGTGVNGPITQLMWTDAGATPSYGVTFPLNAEGEPAGTRWVDSTGSSFTTAPITSGGNIYSQSYYLQYSQNVAYSTSDTSTFPVGQTPQILYTVSGVVQPPLTLTTSQVPVWMDAKTTATVPAHVYGVAGERWVVAAPGASWTITKANIVASSGYATVNYFHQYQQAVSYSTNDGKVPSPVPKLSYKSNGTAQSYTLTTSTFSLYIDATTVATVPSPITESATEQYVTPTSSWTITGPGVIAQSTSGVVQYSHQFVITLTVSPPGTGTTSPTVGTPVWETTATPFSIIATPAADYVFSSWSPAAGITVADTSAESTTASITATGIITANFVLQSGLSFSETGNPLGGGTSWSVTITAAPAGFTCPGSGQPVPPACTITSTGALILLSGVTPGVYSYDVPSPQAGSPGTQYVVSSVTNGNPGSVNVNPSANINVQFTAQYYLTTKVVTAGAGIITVNTMNCAVTPGDCWFDQGAVVTLTATATVAGWTLGNPAWTSLPSCTPSCTQGSGTPTSTITVTIGTTPETAQANFVDVPSICFTTAPGVCTNTASYSAVAGTGLPVNVTVTGGYDMITLGTNPSPPPSGITVTYGLPNPYAASATGFWEFVTVNIPAGDAGPAYTFKVTATDSLNQEVQGTLIVTILQPQAFEVGTTPTPYAVTFASQSAVFYSDGHWFVFYTGYDSNGGTSLIYRSSTNAGGSSWNAPVLIEEHVTQGYSFAVANNGTDVYLALITGTDLSHFWFDSGQVTGDSIHWTPCSLSCISNGPADVSMFRIPVCAPGCGLFASGSPTILVDKSSPPQGSCSLTPLGACIWVSVPALDSSLMWHVEVDTYHTPSPDPSNWQLAVLNSPQDIHLHAVYSVYQSTVHAQFYMMKDVIAAMFSVGNTPEYPHITILDHADNFIQTYSLPASGELFYIQQSQAFVQPGTDTLFFVGLTSEVGVPGATVWYFSFTFTPVGQVGTFSAPTQVAAVSSITANRVTNHSWHVSITYSDTTGNVYLSYGIDNELFALVGVISGDSIIWAPNPTPVSGVNGLVGGVTLGSGAGAVGDVWVQQLGSVYVVEFAVV